MAAPYDGRMMTYLGAGLAADRPAAPNSAPGILCLWYSTDSAAFSFWESTIATWSADYSAAPTTEQIQDMIATFLVAGANVSLTYNDGANTLTIASTDTTLTAEQVQDIVGALIQATGTGITVTYDDGANTLTIDSTITQYTNEMAQDTLAAMLVAGTNITLTYNDGANTLTIDAAQRTDESIQDVLSTFLVAGTNVTLTYNDAGNTLTISASGGGSSVATVPRGRLTLVSNTPIMSSDQTAKTTIYYTPYIGNSIPLYDGSITADTTFAELTLSLDTTNHTSGSLYDVFVWNDSGTVKVGTGPAWSSTTSRGTGAGTTELEMKNGFWTNKQSITLKNGAGAGIAGVAANRALYVGTFYATANGQTGMAFKPAAANGGTANILGLYNSYNRVETKALCRDNGGGADWTYNSTTWRQANNNANNRISWVDGLQQSGVVGINSQIVFNVSTSGQAVIGLNLDSTTAAPGVVSAAGYISNGVTVVFPANVTESFTPQLGFHYVQRMEVCSAAITMGFAGSAASPTRQSNGFTLALEM